MRLYKTQYMNNSGEHVSNMFFVMDEDERELLGEMLEILIEDINDGLKAKTLKRWNKWDKMSIEFLQRCTNYGNYDNSECMDLSSKQLFNFVEKTLFKVYDRSVTFERWLDVSIDAARREGWMTPEEMREEMNKRRQLQALYLKRDAAKKKLEEHHSDLRNAHIKLPK